MAPATSTASRAPTVHWDALFDPHLDLLRPALQHIEQQLGPSLANLPAADQPVVKRKPGRPPKVPPADPTVAPVLAEPEAFEEESGPRAVRQVELLGRSMRTR